MLIHVQIGNFIFETSGTQISLRARTHDVLLDLNKKSVTQRWIYERVELGACF